MLNAAGQYTGDMMAQVQQYVTLAVALARSTRGCAGRAANAANSRSRSKTWSMSNARSKTSSRRNP